MIKKDYAKIVEQCWWELQNVPQKELTRELILIAFNKNWRALEHIPDSFQTLDICMEALNKSPEAMKFISRKSNNAFNLWALKKHKVNLHYIKDPTYEICLIAVKQNAWNISSVPENHRSEEIGLIACKSYPLSLTYMKNQTAEMCLMALSKKFNPQVPMERNLYTNVKVCPNPDLETTISNLTKMVQLQNNKKNLKDKLSDL